MMTISEPTTNWAEATRAVDAAQRILVVTHVSPDGDAIGSLLGTANMLAAFDKAVDMAVDGGVPDFLAWLPGADRVQDTLNTGEWDLMISVDASDEARTGEVGAYGRAHSKSVINIDHHPTNTMFGDVHLVMPEAVSTTEVLFYWLQTLDFSLSDVVAVPLLTGLVTDTLGFRTSNVTANTISLAHMLIGGGADLATITERTLDTRSVNKVYLWKHALASVELYEGGVIAANVTVEDAKRAGMSEVSDAGLAQWLIRTNEAMISITFKETPEGRVEISMRSKPGFDVSKIAFEVGGGGHKQAAGATIDGPLQAARDRILPLLIAEAKAGKYQLG